MKKVNTNTLIIIMVIKLFIDLFYGIVQQYKSIL